MLEAIRLTKKYGRHTAVEDISFTLDSCGVYGLLGPNGAGKSTVMGMLSGCLSVSSGQILISGTDISAEPGKAKRHIGFLPETPPVYPEMTPFEYLNFVARVKGLSRREAYGQIAEAVDELTIASFGNRLVKHLSKGQRQRVGIAQALLGRPDILIFDEPSSGLDPRQLADMRALFTRLGKERIVILSSHILGEISTVCCKLIIMSGGRLRAFDSPADLQNRFGSPGVLELTARGSENELRCALSAVSCYESIRIIPGADGTFEISAVCRENRIITEDIFNVFAARGLTLLRMEQKKPGLEDIFLSLTAPQQI